jgi:hypothetical protein
LIHNDIERDHEAENDRKEVDRQRRDVRVYPLSRNDPLRQYVPTGRKAGALLALRIRRVGVP